MDPILATLIWLELHTLDKRAISINLEMIVSLSEQKDPPTLLTDEVGCVVALSDGKFVSVIESCDKIKQLMKEKPP